MIRTTVALGALATALGGASLASSATAPPQITGRVGTGHALVITLTDATGKPVKTLRPGKYKLVVWDFSSKLNFHLKGSNFEIHTRIPFKGRESWSPLTLKRGLYTYWSDAERSKLHGSFRVS